MRLDVSMRMVAATCCLLGSVLMAEAAPVAPPVDVTPETDLPLTPAPVQPVELGSIRWERNWDRAVSRSRETGRPLLVLFDEVPGCHTCVSYGEDVLSHPLIVDAAESLFVPVAIYNNVEGPDRAVLASFGEPEWNNPVVRIVDAERRALAARLSGPYTAPALAHAMASALKSPPAYLALLAAEPAGARQPTERATFAMHCFWEGEAKLGVIDGVVHTSVGFLAGHEVVEVEYVPARVPYERLLSEAVRMECAHRVYARTEAQMERASALLGERAVRSDEAITRSTKDELYRLRHTAWRCVPMTWAQAARVNAAISDGADPTSWLSPRQVAVQQAVRLHREAAWDEGAAGDDGRLVKAWRAALARAGKVE